MKTNLICTIIGAGQTGRGYIAPFVAESEYNLNFVDKDQGLIEKMANQGQYIVNYCGEEKPAVIINDYCSYTNDSEEAVTIISESDVVITAVGSGNIKELVPLLEKACIVRRKDKKLTILVCENGINVKQPLVEAQLDAYITEGIIFCTTLKPDSNSLNLLTEVYPKIPYDGDVEGIEVSINGLDPINNFVTLIKRKIYTYNCLSAVIAYIGYYKNYEIYGEAANDKDIIYLMNQIVKPLNIALSKLYKVPLEEQILFSKLAIKKFQNKEIVDTIGRNVRDVKRKLGSSERLIMPLRICLEFDQSTKYLELVISAALYYGKKEDYLPANPLSSISQIDDLPGIKRNIYANELLFEEHLNVGNIIYKLE